MKKTTCSRGIFCEAAKRFRDRVPRWAYAANSPIKSTGLKEMSREEALKFELIQPNAKNLFCYMCFDLDYGGAFFSARDENLPEPTWIAENRENGHAHLCYELAIPVSTSDKSRTQPQKYLDAIKRGFCRRLKADPKYTGLITKNPLHERWRTQWGNCAPYLLGDLADWLFPHDLIFKKYDAQGDIESRNCALFDTLRDSAYRLTLDIKKRGGSRIHLRDRLLEQAHILNADFKPQLLISEMYSIVRSITKWAWREFSPSKFSEIQAERGRKGGLVSGQRRRLESEAKAEEAVKIAETILAMKPYQINSSEGRLSVCCLGMERGVQSEQYRKKSEVVREISLRLSRSIRTARRFLSKGNIRPKFIERINPWIDLSISRSTWYRRQRVSGKMITKKNNCDT